MLNLQGFPGGINKEADPYLLEETEVPDALNVDFGVRGEISRRNGYARIDSPYEIALAPHRIIHWATDDDEFLIALGSSDRMVWIGSMIKE